MRLHAGRAIKGGRSSLRSCPLDKLEPFRPDYVKDLAYGAFYKVVYYFFLVFSIVNSLDGDVYHGFVFLMFSLKHEGSADHICLGPTESPLAPGYHVLSELLTQLAAKSSSRPLRLLEIGVTGAAKGGLAAGAALGSGFEQQALGSSGFKSFQCVHFIGFRSV